MLRRRVGHDYEQRCVYLVTMTVEGRRPLLGRLVGDAGAESGSSDAPHIELSPLGKQVREMWEAISEYYPEVRVLATMVMPDHLHGILFVERAMNQPLGMVIKGFKAGCNKAYRQAMAAGLCAPMLPVVQVPGRQPSAIGCQAPTPRVLHHSQRRKNRRVGVPDGRQPVSSLLS